MRPLLMSPSRAKRCNVIDIETLTKVKLNVSGKHAVVYSLSRCVELEEDGICDLIKLAIGSGWVHVYSEHVNICTADSQLVSGSYVMQVWVREFEAPLIKSIISYQAAQ